MNSKSQYLFEYLVAQQKRKGQIARRRKQMATGMSPSVPLKTISLNPEQKSAIAAVQETSRQEQESGIATPRRLGALISLSLHLIGALLATAYIVHTTDFFDDTVHVDLLRAEDLSQTRRRLRPRVVRIKTSPIPQIQALRPQQRVATAAQIPTGDARFTLPSTDVPGDMLTSPSDGNAALGTDGLERKLRRGGHRAEISSVLSKIEPSRLFNTSIIDTIESTNIPQADLPTDSVEPPTMDLNDVDQPPRFRHKVAPKYPAQARRAQKEGVVLLEASIGVDGIAKEIKIIRGIGFGCDEAAIKALETSRFAPAKQAEKPVVVRIQIPYRFKLED